MFSGSGAPKPFSSSLNTLISSLKVLVDIPSPGYNSAILSFTKLNNSLKVKNLLRKQ
jgi:hypothetical protein